jgi:hypothetical protein
LAKFFVYRKLLPGALSTSASGYTSRVLASVVSPTSLSSTGRKLSMMPAPPWAVKTKSSLRSWGATDVMAEVCPWAREAN